MNHNRLLAYAHLVMASGYLVFTVVGPWAKRGESFGVFSSDGGTGFGIIGFILAVFLVILAVLRILGRSEVLPGLGVEQLTLVIGVAGCHYSTTDKVAEEAFQEPVGVWSEHTSQSHKFRYCSPLLH